MDITTGMRVRVTTHKDVRGYNSQTHEAEITPAGTVYEGIVTDPDDLFFDLNMPDGSAIGFCVTDPSITIEIVQ